MLALAETLATALIASAVMRPLNRFSPVIVEVFWILADVAVFSVKTVLVVTFALSTLPLSPARSDFTVLERVAPLVPRHGQGWNADLPSSAATGPAVMLANVP